MSTLEWWICIQMQDSRKSFLPWKWKVFIRWQYVRLGRCSGEISNFSSGNVVVESGSCHSTSWNVRLLVSSPTLVCLPTGLPVMVHLDNSITVVYRKTCLSWAKLHVSHLRHTHSWCEKLAGGFSQLPAAGGRMGPSTKRVCIDLTAMGDARCRPFGV